MNPVAFSSVQHWPHLPARSKGSVPQLQVAEQPQESQVRQKPTSVRGLLKAVALAVGIVTPFAAGASATIPRPKNYLAADLRDPIIARKIADYQLKIDRSRPFITAGSLEGQIVSKALGLQVKNPRSVIALPADLPPEQEQQYKAQVAEYIKQHPKQFRLYRP